MLLLAVLGFLAIMTAVVWRSNLASQDRISISIMICVFALVFSGGWMIYDYHMAVLKLKSQSEVVR
jgi:amino acid permease